ncbi:MAG: hypothetical protein HYU36_15695 [Planctomycetes bacterium]|nr:hypothetical protein [Planctomycetota bacterium]
MNSPFRMAVTPAAPYDSLALTSRPGGRHASIRVRSCLAVAALGLAISAARAEDGLDAARATLLASIQSLEQSEQGLQSILGQLGPGDAFQATGPTLKALRAEARAMQEKMGRPDAAGLADPALQLAERLNRASAVVNQITALGSQLASLPQSYSMCMDTKPYHDLQQLLESQARDLTRRFPALLAGTDPDGIPNPGLDAKAQVYAALLMALQRQKGPLVQYPRLLNTGHPLIQEFHAFLKAFVPNREIDLAALDTWMAQRAPQPAWVSQGYGCGMALEYWDRLLALEEQNLEFRESYQPGGDSPLFQRFRQLADQEAGLIRNLIASGLNPDVGHAPQENQKLQEQLERVEFARQGMLEFLNKDKEVSETRKRLDALVQRPVLAKTDIRLRFQRTLKEAEEIHDLFLGVQGKGDRVEALEVDGRFELLRLEMESLAEEAELMAEVLDRREAWQARLRDPRVAEIVRRFDEQVERLKQARASYHERQVMQAKVQQRIRLLELKSELMDQAFAALDGDIAQIEESVYRLADLADAVAEGGEDAGADGVEDKARNRERDADRIPLDDPVDKAVEF